MKKYVVIERTRKLGTLEILNKDTTSLNDIWYSVLNINNLISLDYKFLIFSCRSEAEKFKKAQQITSNETWKKWGHYFKALGQKKPKWVVEEYSNVFDDRNIQII